MCNNCNCDSYDMCSITGHLPIGQCCSKCNLYDEKRTCLSSQNRGKTSDIIPISTSIEGGLIKLIIKKQGKEVPIYIDVKKQFGS